MPLRCAPAETSVVRITGEDAASFLQGQSTADLRGPLPAHTLWLNRKGRVLAHTLVSADPDGSFLLLAPHAVADELIAVVTANVIADDVTAADETAAWSRAVLWGEGVPEAPPGVRLFRSARCGVPSWEVLARPGAALPWAVADFAELERARIEAGVPAVPADCGPGEFPQECGLEAWVSQTKGCYLGQEVMARIHSMGTLRRALRCVRGDAVLSAGLELRSADGAKALGAVRSAAGEHGLALLPADCPEGQELVSVAGRVVVGRRAVLPA